MKALEYAKSKRDDYLAGYNELLRIPSVSTDVAYKDDLNRCAQWIVDEMTRIGFKECRTIPTDGHPVVYGEWLEAGDDKPVVLVYAHYDVQPVDPLDLWESPPFEPTVRDGKLYARGVVDDKAGVWVNLKAFESIFQTEGKLPINVKIFFEGEEEMGSPNVQPFIEANADLLKADVLALCDGGFSPDNPITAYTLRGLVSAEVKLTGPDHDLHSGMYGGAVHNPLHMAGHIINSFHDANGRIQIPGFYDKVQALEPAEQERMVESWEATSQFLLSRAGTENFWAEPMGSLPERLTALPTLDVNGVWGGYQGPGTKTVIPSEAYFKVTMRLVADQDPNEIAQQFKDYVLSFASDTIAVEVDVFGEAYAATLDVDGPYMEAQQQAYEATIGKRSVLVRGGGTVPIAGTFQKVLGLPVVMMGFGSGDNIHSPNEYLNLNHFDAAMEMAIRFYTNVGSVTQATS